ncbi:MAG: hypothetical protein AAF799_42910 [Myxococcota bacterium]
MRLGLAVVAMMLVGGCGSSDSAFGADTEDFIDEPTPPGNCSAGTSAGPCPNDTGGNPAGSPCLEPDDCAAGVHCVAPYDDGEVGDFACSDQCIDLMDEQAWCLDAAACCTEGAICRRGLCVLEDGVDESGTAGSDSGDTGTGSGSDSGSGGSSDGTSTGGSDSGSESGAGSSSTGMR